MIKSGFNPVCFITIYQNIWKLFAILEYANRVQLKFVKLSMELMDTNTQYTFLYIKYLTEQLVLILCFHYPSIDY